MGQQQSGLAFTYSDILISLQDEFIASTKDALMYRQCMHELSDMVAKGKASSHVPVIQAAVQTALSPLYCICSKTRLAALTIKRDQHAWLWVRLSVT